MDCSRSFVRIPEYFRSLVESREAGGPIGEVMAWLATENPVLDHFGRLVNEKGLRHEDWFRRQIADVVLEYIRIVRSLRPISEEQLVEIELLKDALHVREGELLQYRAAEITAILCEEVDIALNDGLLSEEDDLHLVRLQIAFDLGYDEFLSRCRTSLERGIDALTYKSVHQSDPRALKDLEVKVAHLTPLARLAALKHSR